MGDDATGEPPTTGRLDQQTMQTIGRRRTRIFPSIRSRNCRQNVGNLPGDTVLSPDDRPKQTACRKRLPIDSLRTEVVAH